MEQREEGQASESGADRDEIIGNDK
jgi:hypothetical protein